MRDFTTIVSIYGKTAVSLSTWRNANGTAFASVTIANPWNTGDTFDAKSQGPSAGGYHKPTQALQRLSAKLGAKWFPNVRQHCQSPQTWAQMVAQAAESMLNQGGKF